MDRGGLATYGLLFDVRRSVRYHRRRARFFDRWGKLTNFLNVVFGSTAVASAISATELLGPTTTKIVGIAAALLVTIVSALDLVVSTSTKARDHSDLARRFIDLEKEITLVDAPTEKILREFDAKRLTIEGDEPHVMRMLDILCQNELLQAMGHKDEMLWKVGWFKRRFAQVIDFDTESVKQHSPAAGLPAAEDPAQKALLS